MAEVSSSKTNKLIELPATVVLPTMFVAVWSVFCAALLHHGCFDISATTSQPFPTTPRAEYCDSVNSATPWLTFTILPTVLMGLIAWLGRVRPRRVAAAAFTFSLLLIANAAFANSLSYTVGLR